MIIIKNGHGMSLKKTINISQYMGTVHKIHYGCPNNTVLTTRTGVINSPLNYRNQISISQIIDDMIISYDKTFNSLYTIVYENNYVVHAEMFIFQPGTQYTLKSFIDFYSNWAKPIGIRLNILLEVCRSRGSNSVPVIFKNQHIKVNKDYMNSYNVILVTVPIFADLSLLHPTLKKIRLTHPTKHIIVYYMSESKKQTINNNTNKQKKINKTIYINSTNRLSSDVQNFKKQILKQDYNNVKYMNRHTFEII
jgi:hypothetical protein